MKVKYLVHKKTNEFAEIQTFGGEYTGMYTSLLPNRSLSPDTTFETFCDHIYKVLGKVDLSDYEIREFDVIESGEIGADIRNKLSPFANLIALLDVYFKENDVDKQKNILKYIKADMKQGKKNIKYLSDLL